METSQRINESFIVACQTPKPHPAFGQQNEALRGFGTFDHDEGNAMICGHLLGDSAGIPFIDEGNPHCIARDFLNLLGEFVDFGCPLGRVLARSQPSHAAPIRGLRYPPLYALYCLFCTWRRQSQRVPHFPAWIGAGGHPKSPLKVVRHARLLHGAGHANHEPCLQRHRLRSTVASVGRRRPQGSRKAVNGCPLGAASSARRRRLPSRRVQATRGPSGCP